MIDEVKKRERERIAREGEKERERDLRERKPLKERVTECLELRRLSYRYKIHVQRLLDPDL